MNNDLKSITYFNFRKLWIYRYLTLKQELNVNSYTAILHVNILNDFWVNEINVRYNFEVIIKNIIVRLGDAWISKILKFAFFFLP